MREQERRLLRCITAIDDELVLEADTARFRPKRWGGLIALAACLALVLALPRLWNPKKMAGGFEYQYTTAPEPPAANETAAPENEKAEGPEQDSDGTQKWAPAFRCEAILQEETVGGLSIGMNEAEIQAILGQADLTSNVATNCPDGSVRFSWFYKTGTDPETTNDTTLSLADLGSGLFLNEVHLRGDSTLALSSGIRIGSSKDAVEQAYPDAVRTQEESVENDVILHQDIYTVDGGLQIRLTEGICDSIILGPWLVYPPDEAWEMEQDFFPYVLTSEAITIHLSSDAGWQTVKAVDKAAKRISTVLTISEPEPGEMPEGMPLKWLDLGSGTVVGLLGDDYAVVYTCAGDFDPDSNDNLTPHLSGRFEGLDDAVRQATANPTETWEIEP